MPRAEPPPGPKLHFMGRRDWPIEDVVDDWGLTPTQQETYVELFRRHLATKNAWKEETDDYFTLRRFLRARTYNIDNATIMWLNHMQWKEDFQVDTILQDFYFGERDKFLICFPQGYHKTDKMGRPVYIQQLGQVNVTQLKKVTTEDRMLKFHIQEYERCVKVIMPICSHIRQKQIDQTFGIMDVRGVGLSHLTGEVRRLLGLITKYDQDNYPEMLGHICIINAPSMFRMLWSAVKGMLDPRTQSKIEILGTDYLPTLLHWVDADNLPIWLGGNSAGSLLDDVGPWSDPDMVARLGLDLEQLRLGNKPHGSLLPMPSRRHDASFETPGSFRRGSESQSELYQSPESSAVDLSSFRASLRLNSHGHSHTEVKHLSITSLRTHTHHTPDRHSGGSPSGTPGYAAIPTAISAIPEQPSGPSHGGAKSTQTLVQRVAELEATLQELRPQMEGLVQGLAVADVNANGNGMDVSTKSAPPGSLLYRVEMLEEAVTVLTSAYQVALQNQQRILNDDKRHLQEQEGEGGKSSMCCCCSIM